MRKISPEARAMAQATHPDRPCACFTHGLEPLPEARLGPNHDGVRFYERNEDGHYIRPTPKLTITVDGEVVDRVFEYLSGEDGWVALYPGPPCHICSVCVDTAPYGEMNVCAEIRRGRVEVSPREENTKEA